MSGAPQKAPLNLGIDPSALTDLSPKIAELVLQLGREIEQNPELFYWVDYPVDLPESALIKKLKSDNNNNNSTNKSKQEVIKLEDLFRAPGYDEVHTHAHIRILQFHFHTHTHHTYTSIFPSA